jgi:CubicO group peptidase (beta-lactamase class C family)
MYKRLFPCRILLTTLLTLALLTAANGRLITCTQTSNNTGRSSQRKTDIAARIQRVENGLLPPTVIKGQPLPQMKLAERMKYYKIPGVSIAVINNYKIEWTRGYGVREAGTNEAITPDMLFQAGSVSKVVTAVATMSLVQQGKLSLDEDVNKKLSSWKVPENEFTKEQKVTIRRILTHTAGLTPSSSGEYPLGSEVPTLLQVLDGQKPANTPPIRVIFIPGSIYGYSGSGFFILQQLLIDVTGKPFPRLMQEMIFNPLKMKDSTFEQPLPQSFQTRAATGHYPGDTVVKGKWETKPEMAAAGLWTTAPDLARFAIEMQKSKVGKSKKILSKEMTDQMLTPQQSQMSGGEGISVEGRGLGFELNVGKNFIGFGHGGRTTGYVCQLIAFDDGKGAVIMTNGYNQGLIREILRSIAHEYGWSKYQAIERVVIDLTPQVLEEYAGEYEFPEGRTPRIGVVSVKNGKLYFDGILLQAESETRFFGTGEATYVFNKDEKGQVKEMIFEVGTLKLTAKKIK